MSEILLIELGPRHYRPARPGERPTHRQRGEARPESLVPQRLPCIHLGEPTGDQIAGGCASCGDTGALAPVHRCDVHGQCTPAIDGYPGIQGCARCSARAYAAPISVTPVDPGRLTLGEAGFAFNGSFCDFRGRRLLAYRDGWAGSELHVAELGPDLQPVGPSVRLTGLAVSGAADYGREDPRLFVHRDALHVAYTGVQAADVGGAGVATHQCVARLGEDFRVLRAWSPQYQRRQPWEKNWACFSALGELWAVYSPHVVLHLHGPDAWPFAECGMPGWSGGIMRGGAAPVRVGDDFYHWFHGVVPPGGAGPDGMPVAEPTYTVGCYVFGALPPFRVRRLTPAPLVWGKPIVFPCGAVLDGERWLVSCGVHDRSIEVFAFARRDVERSLKPI